MHDGTQAAVREIGSSRARAVRFDIIILLSFEPRDIMTPVVGIIRRAWSPELFPRFARHVSETNCPPSPSNIGIICDFSINIIVLLSIRFLVVVKNTFLGRIHAVHKHSRENKMNPLHWFKNISHLYNRLYKSYRDLKLHFIITYIITLFEKIILIFTIKYKMLILLFNS